MRRQRRSNTRGFLSKCQPPACQGVRVATTDKNVKDAVPGPEHGKHQTDYRVGDTERESGRQNTTPGPWRTTMNLKQGRWTFTQNSIEALHRRVLSGHMVIPEAVAWAGGTQSDAAVAENTGRPFWCQKEIPKRREMSSATTWDCMTYFSNCWWTMGRQNAAATEAYAPDGTKTCPWRWRSWPRRTCRHSREGGNR